MTKGSFYSIQLSYFSISNLCVLAQCKRFKLGGGTESNFFSLLISEFGERGGFDAVVTAGGCIVMTLFMLKMGTYSRGARCFSEGNSPLGGATEAPRTNLSTLSNLQQYHQFVKGVSEGQNKRTPRFFTKACITNNQTDLSET